MSEDEPIAVWDVLKEFGFLPDSAVRYSDDIPGLSFDFGNFKLEATTGVNRWFREVVLFQAMLDSAPAIQLLFGMSTASIRPAEGTAGSVAGIDVAIPR